jgi:hypothetical protein
VTVISGHAGKTVFYVPGTVLDSIDASDADWLLVTGIAPELHGPAIGALGGSVVWEQAGAHAYTTELRRGSVMWTLYHRVAQRAGKQPPGKN